MSDAALVLITTSFPIAGDGSEAAGSFVSDLAEELAHHMPVRVVAPGSLSAREQWAPNVEVFRYAAPAKPLSTLKPWRPMELMNIVSVLRAGARATHDAVHAGSTAHMLALWALPSGEWARRVSRATGVPYSVWTLGSDIWVLGRIPLVRSLLRHVLYNAHTCYSDGLQLADDTRRIAGRGVDFLPSTRRIESRGEPPLADSPPYRMLFLGRWHCNKGVDLLLDALDMLDDIDWSRIASVEIQGGGPLEGIVRERVGRLCAQGRPVEAGRFLVKAEAEAAIVRADWVLIPSRIESIPVVFSDAMKLGRPVISTPVGDLPRLLAEYSVGVCSHDVTGAAFAAAIREGLSLPPTTRADAIGAVVALFSMSGAIVPKILGMLGNANGHAGKMHE